MEKFGSFPTHGATLEFVVDDENSKTNERDSPKLAEEEGSIAVPFPDPC